ncbi:GDP-mannose 4,6-dehydratase [Methanomethylovorans sp.]|uniref:GDP-mannose 4,6-dehydratase n=1 Tax=Methanomethylovorans sp. TaxID=2758717 RepID=UPI003D13CDA3
MQKILITGGLGQVGSYLVDALHEKAKITVLDNYSSTTREAVPPEVNVIKGDVKDRMAADLVNQNDVVIHTAAQISVTASMKDPLFDAQNNVFGTLNLLEAARRSSISKFIYISSAAVYGDPINVPITESHPQDPLSPYGVSKLSGEKYCMMYNKAFGLPSCCIRPFNIYSPRQDPGNPYSGVISRFIEKARAGQSPVIFGDGTQTRDFISVHDIVDIIQLLLEKEDANGHVFNAGTGNSITVSELANMVLETFDVDVPVRYMPERPGDIKYSCSDISKARKILGFEPKVSLREGLMEFAE